MNINGNRKIFVTGHQGMVGSAVCRRLRSTGCEIQTAARDELDLTQASPTNDFFAQHQPDTVIFAAEKVGGILANQSYPVEFLTENLKMAVNTIDAAYRYGVKRLLFLCSTCIYPRDCQQPIKETALMSGPLEPTNEGYALAKIAGGELKHIRPMPTVPL